MPFHQTTTATLINKFDSAMQTALATLSDEEAKTSQDLSPVRERALRLSIVTHQLDGKGIDEKETCNLKKVMAEAMTFAHLRPAAILAEEIKKTVVSQTSFYLLRRKYLCNILDDLNNDKKDISALVEDFENNWEVKSTLTDDLNSHQQEINTLTEIYYEKFIDKKIRKYLEEYQKLKPSSDESEKIKVKQMLESLSPEIQNKIEQFKKTLRFGTKQDILTVFLSDEEFNFFCNQLKKIEQYKPNQFPDIHLHKEILKLKSDNANNPQIVKLASSLIEDIYSLENKLVALSQAKIVDIEADKKISEILYLKKHFNDVVYRIKANNANSILFKDVLTLAMHFVNNLFEKYQYNNDRVDERYTLQNSSVSKHNSPQSSPRSPVSR